MNQIHEVAQRNIIYEALPRVKVENHMNTITSKMRYAGNTPGALTTYPVSTLLCGEKDGDSLCAPAYSSTASPRRSLHLKKKKALKADLSKAVGKQIGARVDHLISFENLTESHYRGITVVWVFLCANDAGCGWLGTADARFVTQTGAPGCFSSQPSGHLNRLPSLERRSKYNDEDAENCDNYGKSFYHLPSMRNV